MDPIQGARRGDSGCGDSSPSAACPRIGRGTKAGRSVLEIIQEIREIPGVHGIHVMAYRQEHLVAEIIEEAGLLPRRVQRERAQWDLTETTQWKRLLPRMAAQ